MIESLTPILLGYSLGSTPVGYLLARRYRGVDLRRVGSGNIGATNAYRSAGLAFALVVMGLDMLKGAGSVLLAATLREGAVAPAAAGVAAILGHIYPVWLRFRGGKGVATACGAFAVLAPVPTAVAAALFVVTVGITRYVSLGSVIGTASLPAIAWLAESPLPVVVGGAIAAACILERHRANLSRLAAGTERRLRKSAARG